MKVPDIIMAEDFFPHRITFDKKKLTYNHAYSYVCITL